LVSSKDILESAKRLKILHQRGLRQPLAPEVFLMSEEDESWDDDQEDDWTDDEWGEDEGWGEDEDW
jgi:hypothetical protein